jgi:thioredoxin reductase (NADPH)
MGCMAALEAERFLAELGEDAGKDVTEPLGYGAEAPSDAAE